MKIGDRVRPKRGIPGFPEMEEIDRNAWIIFVVDDALVGLESETRAVWLRVDQVELVKNGLDVVFEWLEER